MKTDESGLRSRLDRLVWGTRVEPPSPWQARALRLVRTLLVLGRDLAFGQLTLRAMSLVYTTLLSIVPLLALSFSVLKAFGVSNRIEPMLLEFVAPLGEKGGEIVRRIVQFIENMNVGVLGGVGLALLLYTSVSLMQKVEDSLNYIWHIPQPRRLAERYSRYLSVLLVGPILVVSAVAMTATLMNIDTVRAVLEFDALDRAVQIAGRVTPYLLVIAAFTFVYAFIPNTRVRLLPALAGGAVGGIAWQTVGWAFAIFVASSNSYSAIYAGFAILLLFMVWLYLSWLVLLFGASVAFYVQHPEYLYVGSGEPRQSNRMRERLALSVMTLVAQRFVAGTRLPSLPDLARRLGAPMHALTAVVGALEAQGIVVLSADEPPLLLPARDLSLVPVAQLLRVVRQAGEQRHAGWVEAAAPGAVDDVLERVDRAVDDALGGMSLLDLASPGAAGPPAPI